MNRGDLLLALARERLEELLQGKPAELYKQHKNDAALQSRQGLFVTLKRQGHLRGCIGHILGTDVLLELVRELARAAAFQDPRFPPLRAEELATLSLEISLLTVPVKIESWQEIVTGRDGILLQCRGRTAVFLPQVATEQGWTREETLEHLTRKAALEKGAWKDPLCELQTFQAEVFTDIEP